MIELAKPSREEWIAEAEETSNRLKQEWLDLMALDLELEDEDGYPTNHALDIIEKWHWSEPTAWFKFVENLWAYHDFGWTETEGGVDGWTNQTLPETTRRFHISTAGWSGNESLIRAMEKNWVLWGMHWVQSRRGGHYIFEIKDEKERTEI